LIRRYEEPDRAGNTRGSRDEAAPLEGKNHLVHGRRRDSEEPRHVGLGRRPPVDDRVGTNERQVLALEIREPVRRLVHVASRPVSQAAALAGRFADGSDVPREAELLLCTAKLEPRPFDPILPSADVSDLLAVKCDPTASLPVVSVPVACRPNFNPPGHRGRKEPLDSRLQLAPLHRTHR